MRRVRDRQRARVYAWEDRIVAPRDQSTLPYPAAKDMVGAIWADLNLRYPPEVERLPGQARRLQADDSRLLLRLPPTTPSWLLLHEMAHALTCDGARMSLCVRQRQTGSRSGLKLVLPLSKAAASPLDRTPAQTAARRSNRRRLSAASA